MKGVSADGAVWPRRAKTWKGKGDGANITTDDPVLLQVQQHDYIAMYESEITKREQFFYPPFHTSSGLLSEIK